MKGIFLLLISASSLDGVNALMVPSRGTLGRTVSVSSLGVTTATPPDFEARSIPYGEESRRYRRTVYSHDDWAKHRSPDRFVRNIKSLLNSGVYKNIMNEVLTTVAIATVIVGFNMLAGGYTDFSGEQHAGILAILPVLSLPLAPFTLSSPSLGLLLVFRTNTSYQRWDEARKNWGMNINHTRDLVRMASAYYDREGVPESIIKQDLDRVALNTWAFVRAMKRHLSPEWEDEEPFKKELYEKLPEKQAEKILAAKHRPNRALQDLSFAIEALPMNFIRRNEIHRAATIFEDNLGSSERLLSSPVPLFYTRHTARFTFLWLSMLPFALYGQFGDTWNHVGLIPSTAAISVALFGIEELATQLEEPFTILPMQTFCDKIYNWCTEIASWEPNDNGMFTDEYMAEVRALKEINGNQKEINGLPKPEQNIVDCGQNNRQGRLRSLFSRF